MRITRTRLAPTLLALLALFAPQAHAQGFGSTPALEPVTDDGWYLDSIVSKGWGGDGVGDMGVPVSAMELTHAIIQLELTGDQAALVREQYAELLHTYRSAWVTAREAEDDLRRGKPVARPTPEEQRTLSELKDRLENFHDELREQFFSDLAIVLTPDQTQRLQDLTESRQREAMFRRGALGMEGLDLTWTVEAADLNPTDLAAATAVLDEHTSDIEPLLTLRAQSLDRLEAHALDYLALSDEFSSYARENPESRGNERWERFSAQLADKFAAARAPVITALDHAQRLADANAAALDRLNAALSADGKKRIDTVLQGQIPPRLLPTDPLLDQSLALRAVKDALKLEATLRNTLITFQARSEGAFFSPLPPSGSSSALLPLIAGVEPLTQSQRDEVITIRDALTQQLQQLSSKYQDVASHQSQLEARYRPDRWIQLDGVMISLTSRTPRGAQTNEPSAEEQRRLFERNNQRIKEAAAFEQEALDRLREILTLRQRAALLL